MSRSNGWAGGQTAGHWLGGLFRDALELALGWGWQGVPRVGATMEKMVSEVSTPEAWGLGNRSC